MALGVAIALTACSAAPAPAPAHAAAAPAHWDYGPEHGPAHWASLEPEFSKCDSGERQSPIDLPQSATEAATDPPVRLEIDRREHAAEVTNNGHTIQVDEAGADILTIGDEAYSLVQYHFHSPSENTVGGQYLPMEMHLVHKSAAGGLAVLAVFIQEGAENPSFAPVWTHLRKEKGHVSLKHAAVVDKILPTDWTIWRFDGSLTTPPCSEGVKWLVFREPISLSAQQIAAFRSVIDGNNRPTQPLQGRPVSMGRVLPASK
jgi:carbonic anhydrase